MPSRSVDYGSLGVLHFFPLDAIELRAGLISSHSDTQGRGKTENKLIFWARYLTATSAFVPHLSNEHGLLQNPRWHTFTCHQMLAPGTCTIVFIAA